MTVLVTGGAGFIGINFIYHMLASHPGYRIVCVDKLTYASNHAALTTASETPYFRFIKADICDREHIYSIFEEISPDIVVNFAAESHVDRSISSPEIFLRTNIGGTAVLMDGCLKYGVKRFHQISTDEVYGDLPLDRPELKFTEQSPVRTSSPYSASKASADLLVQAYCRTYGLNATISRCSNNYGSYQHTEKLIPKIISNALQNKPIPVYGSGLNVRDWIYVNDHCKAVDLIIHKGRSGEIYNVGANCEIANIDIVKRVLRIMHKPESLIEYVPDRKGHDLRYAIDPQKLRTQLGWQPETDFSEGICRTVRHYCETAGQLID